MIPLFYALHFEMQRQSAAADAQMALLQQRLSSSDFAIVQAMMKTLRIIMDAVQSASEDSPTAQVTALLWQMPGVVKGWLHMDRPNRLALVRFGHHPAFRELGRKITASLLTSFLPSSAEKLSREAAEILPDGRLLLGAAASELRALDVAGLIKQGKRLEAQERLLELEDKIIYAGQQPSIDPSLPRAALFKLIDVRAILAAPVLKFSAGPAKRQQVIENLHTFVQRYPELHDYEASLLIEEAWSSNEFELGRLIATRWERIASGKLPPLEARMMLELKALDPWHARLAAEKILALKPDHPEAKEVLQLTAGALRKELAKLVAHHAEPPDINQKK